MFTPTIYQTKKVYRKEKWNEECCLGTCIEPNDDATTQRPTSSDNDDESAPPPPQLPPRSRRGPHLGGGEAGRGRKGATDGFLLLLRFRRPTNSTRRRHERPVRQVRQAQASQSHAHGRRGLLRRVQGRFIATKQAIGQR